MPRRKKLRRCEEFRGMAVFKPLAVPMRDLTIIDLEHDELEALRLCDRDGLTQEEAGDRMGISRGTVQRLLSSGRAKLVEFILSGTALHVVPVSNYQPKYPRRRSANKEPDNGCR